jgi:hypothetical protein
MTTSKRVITGLAAGFAMSLAVAAQARASGWSSRPELSLHCREDTNWSPLIQGLPEYKGASIQYRYTGYWFDEGKHYHLFKLRSKSGWRWIELPEPIAQVCGTGASKKHPPSSIAP